MLFSVDWQEMWVPSLPLLDLVIRGTVIYLILFVYFRILRREAGNLGVTDVLFVVLIADVSQNAMAHEYKSITEGLVLIATMAFWDTLLNALAYRWRFMEKLIEPPPMPMIKNGVMMRRNMRRELITADELESQLRLRGVTDIADVQSCLLESNGEFSVIRKDGAKVKKPPPRKKV
jgi:uncharacterized membrane protein YcaP (DUF421 family)